MLDKKMLRGLYIDKRKSASEIARVLKCSTSTINYWLKVYQISKRSISDAIYARRNPDGDPFVPKNPKTIEEGISFGIGLGLYWGEGNKSNRTSVRLGNTDPRIIKRFIDFLKKFYAIKSKKIKFGLQIFSDMNPQRVLKYWKQSLGVQRSQFQKIVVTGARSLGTYRKKSQYGVLTVYFHNKKLRDIIIGTLESL